MTGGAALSRRALLMVVAGASVACLAPIVRTLAAMDAAGVRRTILMGFGPDLPDLVRRHPDRLAAAALVRDHANLAFDLSAKNALYDAPGGSYGWNALHGVRGMAEGWRQLMEAHRDRDLLASLEPATARAVGYENAARIFSL